MQENARRLYDYLEAVPRLEYWAKLRRERLIIDTQRPYFDCQDKDNDVSTVETVFTVVHGGPDRTRNAFCARRLE